MRTSRGATMFLLIFGLLLLAVSAWSLVRNVVEPVAYAQAAKRWTQTQCRVTSSKILEEKDSDGDIRYRADVAYAYEAAGQRFHSRRISFQALGETAEDTIARYPNGSAAPCFHDPEQPSEAVLDRGMKLRALFVSLFVTLGVGSMGVGLLSTVLHEWLGARRTARSGRTGPARLVPDRGSSEILIPAGFASSFSAMPFAIEPHGWQIAGLALSVLVALALQLWLWHGVIKRFAVRANVVVSGPAHLGERLEVAIRVRNFLPLQFLTVQLVGQQETALPEDSDAAVRTHEFFERELLDLTDRRRNLTVSVELPEQSSPTFHAEDKATRWLIRFTAAVKLWPLPLVRDYEVYVGPSRRG